ncbi:hypothetical protein [Yoonia sp.]|uniref:hypothetical protein n=1 Tax=Yoonia sp. TaxID=2212373 RepID=UPI00358DF485
MDGVDIGNIVSAELSYQNYLDRIETIRADGKIEGADPSIAAITGTMVVGSCNNTPLKQAIGGHAYVLTFGYARLAGEVLTGSLPRVFLPRPHLEISEPQLVQVTFA